LAAAGTVVWACLPCCASMAGEPLSGKAALVLELPQPRFVGTPINIKTPNLEKPLPGKRPDLLVPVGVTNVALKKPVTAGDTSPIMGELSQVTNGDKDGIEGSYVEIGPGKQWCQGSLSTPLRKKGGKKSSSFGRLLRLST